MMAKKNKNDYWSPFLEEVVSKITPEEQARTDAQMGVSAKIYDAMKEKGWTQTQLAEALGKQVSVISKWLSGTHNFTIDTLTDIEGVLKIRLLDLEGPAKKGKYKKAD